MVEKREVWWPNGKASVSGPGITEDCGFESRLDRLIPSFFVNSTYLGTLSFATRPVCVTLPSNEIFSVLSARSLAAKNKLYFR
ncbi:hypothetical protein WAI453_003836 [Rhynchosporium graminicola]